MSLVAMISLIIGFYLIDRTDKLEDEIKELRKELKREHTSIEERNQKDG